MHSSAVRVLGARGSRRHCRLAAECNSPRTCFERGSATKSKKKTAKHVPKAKKKRDVAICEKQRTTIKMFLAATNRDIPSRFVLLLLAPVASLLVAFFIIFIF